MEVDDIEEDEAKGVEDDDVKNDDVEEEEEEDNDVVEDDDVEEDDRSQDRDPHFARACTIEMRMNVSQVTKALLCGTLQTKREPNSRGRLSANLRIRHAHGDVTRTILFGNLQVKGRRPRASQTRTARFLRACTVKMHLDMSQEQFQGHFARDFRGKVARIQTEHLDQSPASTLTVRTPEHGHAA